MEYAELAVIESPDPLIIRGTRLRYYQRISHARSNAVPKPAPNAGVKTDPMPNWIALHLWVGVPNGENEKRAMRPLAIDLFCGLGGWAEGFLSEGWDVTSAVFSEYPNW